MLNPHLEDEKKYLEEVVSLMEKAKGKATEKIEGYTEGIVEKKKYVWSSPQSSDMAERAISRMDIEEDVIFAEMALKNFHQLEKSIKSPYFGRIDFKEEEKGEEAYYIGIYGFSESTYSNPLVFDWRAPLSSIFYDFEKGEAFYEAPSGVVSGELARKRQYKIRDSQMEYMIESDLNINDDVLQKELSKHSNEKMKNIVSTIQKEQNAIIRNNKAKVLIIQGAAGSGKTSIALHRTAFLLYRNKGNLRSENFLIISPNKVFGSYISNVLPELGEENIYETGFEDLAEEFLGEDYKFQTFFQQVEKILENKDKDFIKRLSLKATVKFIKELNAFLKYADEEFFQPEDINYGGFRVSKAQLKKRYELYKSDPIKTRIEKMGIFFSENYKMEFRDEAETAIARKIRKHIEKSFLYLDPLALYKQFYKHIGYEKGFKMAEKNTLEWADVFPLIYVQIFLEGNKHKNTVIKHVLVDEMQDYTPIQYIILKKIFNCPMTILGDKYQRLNPYTSSAMELISKIFPGAECVELNKSYRSTIEIVDFSLKLQENKDIIPMERHGDKPEIIGLNTFEEEAGKISALISAYEKSDYTSLGILCKTGSQAEVLYHELIKSHKNISIIDSQSEALTEGIVITTIHMCKGLEFDEIIISGVSEENFNTQIDQSFLYIACTRAMHKLYLTFTGEMSKFLA
ncbi:MAG: helicase [Lachnospiraceae bacterium]|nr:helicase [Lachnospiraceae bacterium]